MGMKSDQRSWWMEWEKVADWYGIYCGSKEWGMAACDQGHEFARLEFLKQRETDIGAFRAWFEEGPGGDSWFARE